VPEEMINKAKLMQIEIPYSGKMFHNDVTQGQQGYYITHAKHNCYAIPIEELKF
jgi:hypothetical protein